MNIASYIDHTILKPTTTIDEIRKLCEEAQEYGFFAVCVPPPLVKNARLFLKNPLVKVATVIGFPFGYSGIKAKLAEVQQALEDGADELDVVINLIALKSKAWPYLEKEMSKITDTIHTHNRLVKVIIESGVLSDEEIEKCCEIYAGVGVDFLKTSTGYAEKGASVAAVQLMRKHLPSTIQIKASGGIRTYEQATEMIQAGANRLGCSAGINIVKGAGDNNPAGY